MKLHTLKPAPGSSKDTIRKGRGTATGRGKTAGRGQDGQKSRSAAVYASDSKAGRCL